MTDKIINVPNALTLMRIAITPLIVFAILKGAAMQALILMSIAGLSDMLDGAIAKAWHQRTTVGAYMDPIADKLMLISAIAGLFMTGHTPLYLFLAVIFRDVIIVGGAIAYELVTHSLYIQPTMTSKCTTVIQIAYVVMTLFDLIYPLPMWSMLLVAWATFALTCVSGLHYMLLWTIKASRLEGG